MSITKMFLMIFYVGSIDGDFEFYDGKLQSQFRVSDNHILWLNVLIILFLSDPTK